MQNKNNLSPVEQARVRADYIANGLRKIAKRHGVTLREPLAIDANGEFSIVASNGTKQDGPKDACGKFGTFAAVLNRHSPRCGIRPGAILCPENGWCRMNHFEAERLVEGNLRPVVSKLPRTEHDGDWHDKPLKWQVQFGIELQKFATRADATVYARIRQKFGTEREAIGAFVNA